MITLRVDARALLNRSCLDLARYLASVQSMMLRDGLRRAVGEHDTPRLYDWLATVLSYQGIADAAAAPSCASTG